MVKKTRLHDVAIAAAIAATVLALVQPCAADIVLPQKTPQEIERLERLANRGDPEAVWALGAFYAAQWDKQHYEKARHWLKKAYDMNHNKARAAAKIARTHDNAGEIPEAIKWYKIAYREGEKGVALRIANIYQDINEYHQAIEWHKIRHENGDIHGLFSIGHTYYALGDYPKAIEWHEKAYGSGVIFSACKLGEIYYYRLKRYPKAAEWFYTAVARHKDYSCFTALTDLYENLLVPKQDLTKVRELLESEARNGNADAKRALDKRARVEGK
jgi:TPR repeat protein